LTAHSPR
jgi:hypothetical protein